MNALDALHAEAMALLDENPGRAGAFLTLLIDARRTEAELLWCCEAMLELHETGSWGAPPGEYLPALRAAVARAAKEPAS